MLRDPRADTGSRRNAAAARTAAEADADEILEDERHREGRLLAKWRARHAGLPTCVKWAPNMMLVASGCTEGGTALWCSEKHRD